MTSIKFIIIIILVIISFLQAQNINDYIKEGLNFVNNKQYSEAVVSFTKALEFDNKNSEIYFQRGLAKFEIKDFYGAIKDFEKTLEIGHPDERYIFLSNYTLGLSNLNISKYDKAIYYLNIAQKLNPKNSDIYLERGKAKINLGKIDEGCEDFSLAGELGSKNAYDFIQQYCINSVLHEENVDWIKYGETIYYSAYYNPKIIKVSDNIFEVYYKHVINDRNYEEAKYNMFGKSNEEKYKNLKYMKVKCSINIKTEETRDDEAELYNRDNTLIEKHDMQVAYKSLKIDGWQKPVKEGTVPNLIKIVKTRHKE